MQTPKEQSLEILRQVAIDHELPFRILKDPSQDRAAVVMRKDAIWRLYNAGVSHAKIAEYLNRPASSIITFIKRERKKRREAQNP